MARLTRLAGLVSFSLASAVAACLAAGCADSDTDDLLTDADASLDAAKDARAKDSSATVEDDAGDPKKDSGPGPVDSGKTDSGKLDGGPQDAGDGGKTDAGTDAGDAGTGDAGTGDAGADAGADAGNDDGGSAMKPVQGEVVISEVLYNPLGAEPVEEWIELHNTATGPRLLSGLVLKDGASPSHSHTLRAGFVIAPGAYVVLASSGPDAIAAKVPAGAIVYDYNTGVAAPDRLVLGNSAAGSIVLLDGATEIAQAKYGSLGLGNAANGQSIQLKTLTYAAAGMAASWCKSSNVWAAMAGQGTPGAASDCP